MSLRRSGPVLAVLLLLGTSPARADDQPVPSTRLFSFADDAIFESSGLVDRGDVVYTIDDSGDDAVVYGVDPGSGRTLSRTTYADSVEDVEALAPGAGGTVWAGDIGDNLHRRDDVSVYRVTPDGGDQRAPRYRLRYPDGPHDAETLLVHPRTGQVLVVSKSVFGGTVYAAPRRLDAGRDNRLRAFARVGGLVTDGTFFPDGRHVLLRTYGTASVYTFPAFELVGTVRLPAQPQGEGISVGTDGRVLVSSEGVHSDVLRVRLPASLTASPVPSAPTGPTPDAAPPAPVPDRPQPSRDWLDWLEIGAVGAVVGAAAWVTARTARPR